MRFETFKIESGNKEAFSFGAGKNYIKVWSVSVPGTVVYVEREDDGQVVPMVLGDDATLNDFSRLYLSHDKTVEVKITVLVGRDTQHRSAGVVGDVNALARFDNLTKDGNQFFSAHRIPAVSAAYSEGGLYNPVGSGVIVDITRVHMSNTTGQALKFFTLNAGDRAAAWAGALPGQNKEIGLANAQAEFLFGWALSSPIGSWDEDYPAASNNASLVIEYGEAPVRLNEGIGVAIVGDAVNIDLFVGFEFKET